MLLSLKLWGLTLAAVSPSLFSGQQIHREMQAMKRCRQIHLSAWVLKVAKSGCYNIMGWAGNIARSECKDLSLTIL